MTVVMVTLLAAVGGLAAGTAALLVQSCKRSLLLSLAGHFCFCVALVILTTVIGQQLKKPAQALDVELPDKFILMLNLSDWVSEYLYVLIFALVVDIGVSMVLFRGTSVSRLARGYSAATTICLALVVTLVAAATTAGVIEMLEIRRPESYHCHRRSRLWPLGARPDEEVARCESERIRQERPHMDQAA